MEPKFKHDLEIEVQPGSFKKIATVYSFSDCMQEIASKLRIGLNKYSKDWAKIRSLASFQLACKNDKLGGEYINFMNYLSKRDKAAVLYLNNKGDKAFLAPPKAPITVASRCVVYFSHNPSASPPPMPGPPVFPRSPEGPPPPRSPDGPPPISSFSMPRSPEGPPPPIPAPKFRSSPRGVQPRSPVGSPPHSLPIPRPASGPVPLPAPNRQPSPAARSPSPPRHASGPDFDPLSPERNPRGEPDGGPESQFQANPVLPIGMDFSKILEMRQKGASVSSMTEAYGERSDAPSGFSPSPERDRKPDFLGSPPRSDNFSDIPLPKPVGSGKGVKRPFDKIGNTDQRNTAESYNRVVRNVEDRPESVIYHMRNFNNWVKASFIQSLYSATPNGTGSMQDIPIEGVSVLDIGCGKGGDIRKWTNHTYYTRYVGVDIAQVSLKNFIERITQDHRMPVNSIKLGWLDPGKQILTKDPVQVWDVLGGWREGMVLLSTDIFDVVSMQFSLHYFMENEVRLRTLFQNASQSLKPGGHFIATTVDARVLVELLMGHAQDTPDGGACVDIGDKDFENQSVCTILFDEECKQRVLGGSADGEDSGFGLRYWFTLRDHPVSRKGQSQEAVDAPEWMVPLPTLQKVAADFDLELVSAKNFHQYAYERMRTQPYMKMLYNMKVLNSKGSMSETEWRLIRLYMTLHFQKKSTAPAMKKKTKGKRLGREDKERAMKIAQDMLRNEIPKHEWELLSRSEREQKLKKKAEELIASKREAATDQQEDHQQENDQNNGTAKNLDQSNSGHQEEPHCTATGSVIF